MNGEGELEEKKKKNWLVPLALAALLLLVLAGSAFFLGRRYLAGGAGSGKEATGASRVAPPSQAGPKGGAAPAAASVAQGMLEAIEGDQLRVKAKGGREWVFGVTEKTVFKKIVFPSQEEVSKGLTPKETTIALGDVKVGDRVVAILEKGAGDGFVSSRVDVLVGVP